MSNPQDPNFQQPQAEQAAPAAASPAAAPATAPDAPAPAAAPAAPTYQQYQAAQQLPPQPAPQPVAQRAVPTTVGQTNTYALVSILTVMLSPILGIVFGHLGLSQIKRNGDAGRGLALTGVIIGYASIVLIFIFVMVYVSIIGIFFASMGSMMNGYYY